MDGDCSDVIHHSLKGLLSFVEQQMQLFQKPSCSELYGSDGFSIVLVSISPPVPQGKVCMFLKEIVHVIKDNKFIFYSYL